ncbi:MAG: hypothetical protein R3E66_13360 [bacterium]
MEVVGDEFAVWRVHVTPTPTTSPRAAVVLATALGIPVKSATALLKAGPFMVPINQTKEEALELARTLSPSGLKVEPQPVTNPPSIACLTHTKLANNGQCRDCGRWICVVENAQALGMPICEDCFKTFLTRRTFRWVRTTVLLLVLVGVAIWGWNEQQRREERRLWKRPLNIGVFVIVDGDVDRDALDALPNRADEMEDILDAEYRKYGGSMKPFSFVFSEAIALPQPLPELKGDGFFKRVEYTYAMWGFRRAVESKLLRPVEETDSRVYLVVRPAQGKQPRLFEGLAAREGDFGVVEMELAPDTVDLAVITATHEMLHTLGASDHYDPQTGQAIFPQGYADPRNRYPQRYMEIMAHDIPLGEGRARLPSLVGEIRVGSKTAREIGWTQ